MKCNICNKRMVSVYINDPNSTSKLKKSIGKICIECGYVQAPTQYFHDLKKQVKDERMHEENKIGFRKKPKHQREHPFSCCYCHSKRYSKKEKTKPMWASYPNSDGSINHQLNNPRINYTCAKCKEITSIGLPMPHPLPRKYLEPPKEKIRGLGRIPTQL